MTNSELLDEVRRRFPNATKVTVDYSGSGEMVMQPTPMMNFDDETYPDPLKVDFSRRISSVGTFGQGAHRCVGANLARSELTIFLEEWLKRIPDFRLADEELTFQAGVNISYRNLPLVW